jgi:hypothetical protein
MMSRPSIGGLLLRSASLPFERPGLSLVVSLSVAAVSIAVLMAW